MSLKDALSKEDWDQVVQAPFVAGFAVTAADPGGLIGAFRESTAMTRTLQPADGAATGGSIGGAIFEELKTAEGRALIKSGLKDLIKGRKPAEASAAAVARLKDIMAVVAQKAPADYDAVAALVSETATNVAEAAKEGGFLGFGGTPVSDAERQTLSDIEAVLSAAKA